MNNMQDTVFLDTFQSAQSGQLAEPGCEAPLDVEQGWLHLLFDEISHGILVASLKGRVLHLNRAARDEMAHGVLYERHDALQTLSPIEGKLLQAALIKASGGVRSLVKVSGSGVTLMLSVIPLEGLWVTTQLGQAHPNLSTAHTAA